MAEVNDNVIYVNVSGNAVAMPWIEKVPAVLQAWFLGSEAGNSIASILTGDANPSAKLPFTFPVALKDVPAHKFGESSYPGIKRQDSDIWDVTYDEGIFVGYRWYDKEKVKTLFPFGHGLSYTTFSYGKIKLDATEMSLDGGEVRASVTVKNTGNYDADEIVQLYVRDMVGSVTRPVQELKGFQRIHLKKGESRTVDFTITPDLLKFYNYELEEVCEPGEFQIMIGPHSKEVRTAMLTVR